MDSIGDNYDGRIYEYYIGMGGLGGWSGWIPVGTTTSGYTLPAGSERMRMGTYRYIYLVLGISITTSGYVYEYVLNSTGGLRATGGLVGE